MVSYRSTALIASVKRAIQPLAAGVLLSVPFWRDPYGWVVLLCVLGYMWWLTSRPSTKQIWLSGVAFFAVVVRWMYQIHATELIPNNVLAVVFFLLTFTVAVVSLSLGVLLFRYADYIFFF